MEDKDRFDSISVLYKQCWDNYNERRKYESKVSFGVYTVYALSIAGILTQLNTGTFDFNFFVCIIILGAFLFFIHLFWLYNATHANNIDRIIAIHFERILQVISNSTFPDEMISKIKPSFSLEKKKNSLSEVKDSTSKPPSVIKNWSFLSQISISFCLYLALIFSTYINYKRMN